MNDHQRLLTGATHNPEAAARLSETLNGPGRETEAASKGTATPGKDTRTLILPLRRSALALLETATTAVEFVLWATAVRVVVEIIGGSR